MYGHSLNTCWEEIPCRVQLNSKNFYTPVASNSCFHRHHATHYGNQLQVNGDRSFSAWNLVQPSNKSHNVINNSIVDMIDGNPVCCVSEPKQAIKCHYFNDSEKPFVCGNCGTSFIDFGDFRYRQRYHTGEHLYGPKLKKCDEQVTLMKYGRLQRHHIAHSAHVQRRHEHGRVYPCRLCLKKFTKASDARRHEDSVHKGLKPYKCIACGKSFPRKDNCQRHMLTCKVTSEQVTQKLRSLSMDAINFGEVPTAQVADDLADVGGLYTQNWRHMMERFYLRGPSENNSSTSIFNDRESVDSEPLDLRMQSKVGKALL